MKITDTNWFVVAAWGTPLFSFLAGYAEQKGIAARWEEGYEVIYHTESEKAGLSNGIESGCRSTGAKEITVQQFLTLCDEYAAKPTKQVLDLDSNTRVTYKPGKGHINILSEQGRIRLQLSEVTQIAAFIQTHQPQP